MKVQNVNPDFIYGWFSRLTDLVDEQREKIQLAEQSDEASTVARAGSVGGTGSTPASDLQFAMDMLQAELEDLKGGKQKAKDKASTPTPTLA